MNEEKSPMLVVSDLYWPIKKSQTDPEVLTINERFSERMYLALAAELYRLPYEVVEENKEKYIHKMAFQAPERISAFGFKSSIVLTEWQAWAKSLPDTETKKNIFSKVASYLGFSKA